MADFNIKENMDVAPSTATASSSVNQGTNILPQVGMIVMYAGNITQTSSAGVITTTAPAGWLLCNGNTFSATTYPLLNTFLGGTTLPNLTSRYLVGTYTGAAVGTAAGTNTHTHNATGSATFNAQSPPAHNHNLPAFSNTDQSTVFFGAHTHNYSVAFNVPNASGADELTADGTINAVGNHSHTVSGTLGATTSTNTNTSHTHTINANNSISMATTIAHTHSSTITASFGSSTSIPKSLGVNFIIKADV